MHDRLVDLPPPLPMRAGFGIALGSLLAVAAAVALAAAALAPEHAPVELRICNGTGDVLRDVKAPGVELSALGPGRCSAYVRRDAGFATLGFGASLGGRRYERWPEDHAGERPLARGRYTFVLREGGEGLRAEMLGADG